MDNKNLQKTLSRPVLMAGIGLHTGKDVHLVFKPAAVNAGIFFKRTDVAGSSLIPATYAAVKDTRLSTLVGNDQGVTVSTIEHVMAALYSLGITNAVIEVSGPEMPIMDGSSAPFIEALKENVVLQDAPIHYLRVLKEVRVGGEDVWASLAPSDQLKIQFDIDFPVPAIGKQSCGIDSSFDASSGGLLSARTFCLASEVEYMRSKGLALGGSLENAIVVEGDQILNPEGLRFENEFVQHKILDALGDLYTSGFHIIGAFTGHKSSHALNNQLLHALFADKSNYELIPADALELREGVQAKYIFA